MVAHGGEPGVCRAYNIRVASFYAREELASHVASVYIDVCYYDHARVLSLLSPLLLPELQCIHFPPKTRLRRHCCHDSRVSYLSYLLRFSLPRSGRLALALARLSMVFLLDSLIPCIFSRQEKGLAECASMERCWLFNNAICNLAGIFSQRKHDLRFQIMAMAHRGTYLYDWRYSICDQSTGKII